MTAVMQLSRPTATQLGVMRRAQFRPTLVNTRELLAVHALELHGLVSRTFDGGVALTKAGRALLKRIESSKDGAA